MQKDSIRLRETLSNGWMPDGDVNVLVYVMYILRCIECGYEEVEDILNTINGLLYVDIDSEIDLFKDREHFEQVKERAKDILQWVLSRQMLHDLGGDDFHKNILSRYKRSLIKPNDGCLIVWGVNQYLSVYGPQNRHYGKLGEITEEKLKLINISSWDVLSGVVEIYVFRTVKDDGTIGQKLIWKTSSQPAGFNTGDEGMYRFKVVKHDLENVSKITVIGNCRKLDITDDGIVVPKITSKMKKYSSKVFSLNESGESLSQIAKTLKLSNHLVSKIVKHPELKANYDNNTRNVY